MVERCAADGRAADVEHCPLTLHAGVLAHANLESLIHVVRRRWWSAARQMGARRTWSAVHSPRMPAC